MTEKVLSRGFISCVEENVLISARGSKTGRKKKITSRLKSEFKAIEDSIAYARRLKRFKYCQKGSKSVLRRMFVISASGTGHKPR